MNNDLSVGAVGAALITAIIALIGMIIAKENKTSEFRQEWINALRESIAEAVSAVAAMNVISELTFDNSNASLIAETWRRVSRSLSLVELRLNVSEHDHIRLRNAIREAEALIRRATGGQDVSSDLETLQDRITEISQTILKREWDRVKSGEATFQVTKWALCLVIGLAALKWLM